jgi:thioredoxin 1
MNYLEAINSKPIVLVEFFATWCRHCQHMMPVIDELGVMLADSVAIYQYDVDKHPLLAEEHKVDTYPTIIIYRNGQEVWRFKGETSIGDIISMIDHERDLEKNKRRICDC